MPKIKKAIPTAKTEHSVIQPASLFSKITYRGANTSTRVPASLSASPIISSVYFFSLNRLLLGEVKRTGDCATLRCFGQFLIFQVLGMDQFEHRVPKQERILAIVKPPCHLLQIGRQMLCRNPMPRPNDPALEQRKRRLDSVCGH